jgi:ubiquinone/menaquinone biosynthesis C-methylase UbiE
MSIKIFQLPESKRNISDKAWFDLIIQSISNKFVDGVEFPTFPPRDVQERFVGSSYRQTMEDAFDFYKFVKSQADILGKPLASVMRFLDFGCGWGRFMRLFMKDIASENLFGCDVMPAAIDICQSTGIPGSLNLTEPEGKLPYPDNFFDVIIAYSVFSHLPERMNLHWERELARVSSPGCVFCLTLEPRECIDRIVNVPPDTDDARLRTLSKYAPFAKELYRKFDSGEFIYFPTGGGDNLIPDVYGDAIVPLSFIQKKWSQDFFVKKYIDYPTNNSRQARMVVQKKY